MTDNTIKLPQCPVCQATSVHVRRRNGILVGQCGCMLTDLQVRRRGGASKKEVAKL